jgi:hypothetical protein
MILKKKIEKITFFAVFRQNSWQFQFSPKIYLRLLRIPSFPKGNQVKQIHQYSHQYINLFQGYHES